MQFWFPTLCLHSWRSYNGCIAHGTLGVSAGCCCCCCLQFVVMVNVLTMTPLIILPRVWAGWGLREKLGLLGKNDLVCSQGWFQPLDRKLAAILRRRQRLWLALYWESQRWVSLARSPQATLAYVCVYTCACVGVRVCAEKSDECTPMGRERGRSRRVALTPMPFFCRYQSSNTAGPSSRPHSHPSPSLTGFYFHSH